jgi:DNA-binding XRE family transcriptional regulator
MNEDTAAFPTRLRVLREHLGHDVPTFARLVNLSPRTLAKHESGTGQTAKTGTVLAICDATGCSTDWLLTGRRRHDLPRDDTKPMFRRPPTVTVCTERPSTGSRAAARDRP